MPEWLYEAGIGENRAALVGDGETGVSYELGGDVPLTMTEYAAELSRQSGRPVSYQNLAQSVLPPELRDDAFGDGAPRLIDGTLTLN